MLQLIRKKLYLKLLLIHVPITMIGAIGSGVWFYYYHGFRALNESQLIARNEIAKIISSQIDARHKLLDDNNLARNPEYLRSYKDEVYQHIYSYRDTQGIGFPIIIDQLTGVAITPTESSAQLGTYSELKDQLRQIQGQKPGLVTVNHYRYAIAYATFSPWKMELYWLVPETLIYEATYHIGWKIALVLLLVAGSLIGIMHLVTKSVIIKPIEMLRLAAKNITRGDYPSKIPISNIDEVGELKLSMEEMSRTIQAQFTTERRLQKKITAEKEKAERAAELESEFIANMSHELRTPLNGVIGSAELLTESNLNPDQQKALTTLKSSSNILYELINDILEYFKLESGQSSLEIKTFTLHSMLTEVSNLFEFMCAKKGNKFSVTNHIDPNTKISGDSQKVRQILINLISNGNRFTENGRVTLTVEQRKPTGYRGERIAFSVQDTGIGFDDSIKTQIFKSFKQANSEIAKNYGGTGLGLAICDQLARLMQGEITVESKPNQGSSFTLLIPFVKGIGEDSYQSPTQTATYSRNQFANCDWKVLIVEDNKTNQEICVSLLEVLGVATTVVENGKEAVEICGKQKFDIIFMDYRMPIMNGAIATTAIRKGGGPSAKAFIVALTANTSDKEIQSCYMAGMDYFLPKPARKHDLGHALEKYRTRASGRLAS